MYGEAVYSRLSPFLDKALAGEQTDFEIAFTGHDGTTRTARGTYIPETSKQGSVLGVYGLVNDVTQLKTAEDKLRKLAQFDVLTGLPNRSHFNERFDDLFSDRSSNLAVLFIDIDYFKTINDSLGHAGGDLVLKQFAIRLTDTLRPTDFVARLAGDEFVVLLTTRKGFDDAQLVAAKILRSMIPVFKVFDAAVAVTASVGVALRVPTDLTTEALLRRADQALYTAKQSGRNAFHVSASA